jgi:hypothetical protein
MAVVWPAICALAAVAAGAQQAPGADEAPQMRTKVLPGHGYIRYEVLPGDDEVPAGELIVVHEERRAPPPTETAAAAEEPPRAPPRRDDKACSGIRAKLIARLYEVQGLQVEPEFAEWLEKNLATGMGNTALPVQLLGGDPLLISAMKADGVARGLAEDLARCEHRGR